MESKSTYASFVVPEVRPFRRFLAKFMLAVPAMLTLAVAVQTKPDPDGFEYHSSDQTLNNIINNYVPVMQKTAWLAEDHNASPSQIREAALTWIDGWESKHLEAIPRTRYDDMVYDGVSGQIVRTAADINFKILMTAQADYQRGDYKTALKDGFITLRMTQVLRDSDMLLNSVMDVRERRALEIFQHTLPRLSAEERKDAVSKLRTFRTDGPALGALLSRTYSLYLRDLSAGSTNTNTEPSPKHLDQLPSITSLRQLPAGENAVEAIEKVQTQIRDTGPDLPLRPFEAQLLRTLDNQSQTQKQLEKVIAQNAL